MQTRESRGANQVQTLADREAPPRAQDEVYNELYRRLIAAGVVD